MPGAAIPPLPEKKYLGNMGNDFVNKRKEELQNYLNLLAGHEELRMSKVFMRFLVEKEDSF